MLNRDKNESKFVNLIKRVNLSRRLGTTKKSESLEEKINKIITNSTETTYNNKIDTISKVGIQKTHRHRVSGNIWQKSFFEIQ